MRCSTGSEPTTGPRTGASPMPTSSASSSRDDLAVLLTERFATHGHAASGDARWDDSRSPAAHPVDRPRGRDQACGRPAHGGRPAVSSRLPVPVGLERRAWPSRWPTGSPAGSTTAWRSSRSRGLRRASLLMPTIAEGLGVREGAGMSIGLSLRHAWPMRDLLLVLDNFEQLADAAPALAACWPGHARVRLLVTSRSVLNIGGEQVVDVPPLDEPAELFVDRVRSLDPTSTPVGGGPGGFRRARPAAGCASLAIELASAQLRVLRPRALLERTRQPAGGAPGRGTPRPSVAPADPSRHDRLEPRTAASRSAAPVRTAVGVRRRRERRRHRACRQPDSELDVLACSAP